MQRSTLDFISGCEYIWIHSSLMRETSSGYFSSPAVFLPLLFAANIFLIGEAQQPFAAVVCVLYCNSFVTGGHVPVSLDSFKVASQLLFFVAVCKLQDLD